MKCRVQVIIETDAGGELQEIACLERNANRLEDVGLTLADARDLLASVQKAVVDQQVKDYLAAHQCCGDCGEHLLHKGSHQITFRTLFGNLEIESPRVFHCKCRPHENRTFSPLTELLPEHVAPERLYLETKWASLVSFELAAQLLGEALPIQDHVNGATVRRHLHEIAERSEAALGEEQFSFITGCPREWKALPRPPAPLTVGIDGGFVRDWDDKQTHCEVIVGKSMPDEGTGKCFGFVQTYDEKPKRRLFELLKSQGMQFNQQVTFLSDGGEDIRDLQTYLNPEAEHILDWFHVTMRLTVMGQHAKGLPEKVGEDDEQQELRSDCEKLLGRIKHFLWHGNVLRAVEEIEELELTLDSQEQLNEPGHKLVRALGEFHTYIQANAGRIPNYGESGVMKKRLPQPSSSLL